MFYFYGDGGVRLEIKEEVLRNYQNLKSKVETRVNPEVRVKPEQAHGYVQYPLIVGGAGGIGRAIAQVLAVARPEVRRVDRRRPADAACWRQKHRAKRKSWCIASISKVTISRSSTASCRATPDSLFITAGFGRQRPRRSDTSNASLP